MSRKRREKIKSKTPKYAAVIRDTATTSAVKTAACLLVGQFTWRISERVSLK